MQASTNLNEQQAWGGQGFQHNTLDVAQRGQVDSGNVPSSQAGFVASNSDDLFHPVSGGPSPYIFNLPDVPPNPHPYYNTYNCQSPRGLQYPSSSSSYNNPTFTIPPLNFWNNQVHSPPQFLPSPVHNNIPSLSCHISPSPNLPSPLVTPCVQHQSAYNQNHIAQPPAQIHYYFPHPSSLPVSSNSSKPLPSITHISILTLKVDFFAWDEGVMSLLRANGLIGHVLDPAAWLDPSHPDWW